VDAETMPQPLDREMCVGHTMMTHKHNPAETLSYVYRHVLEAVAGRVRRDILLYIAE
jgi:hypothetical protein